MTLVTPRPFILAFSFDHQPHNVNWAKSIFQAKFVSGEIVKKLESRLCREWQIRWGPRTPDAIPRDTEWPCKLRYVRDSFTSFINGTVSVKNCIINALVIISLWFVLRVSTLIPFAVSGSRSLSQGIPIEINERVAVYRIVKSSLPLRNEWLLSVSLHLCKPEVFTVLNNWFLVVLLPAK